MTMIQEDINDLKDKNPSPEAEIQYQSRQIINMNDTRHMGNSEQLSILREDIRFLFGQQIAYDKRKVRWFIQNAEQLKQLEVKNERLVELLKLAYRNWLEDSDVAWAELGKKLCDGLCESMGDVGFQKWMQALRGE